MVPWLMYFFTGCQTYDTLTLEEVKNYKEDKSFSVITKDGREFILTNQKSEDELNTNIVIKYVDCFYCNSWEVIGDTVLLQCSTRDQLSKAPVRNIDGNSFLKIIDSENYRLNPDEIDVIGNKRLSTDGLLLGIMIALSVAGLIIKIIELNADYGGGHKL